FADDPAERYAWDGVWGGDGNTQGAVPVDTNGDTHFDSVLHLVMANNLTWFIHRLYDSSGSNLGTDGQKMEVGVALGKRERQFAINVTANFVTHRFTTGAVFTDVITVPFMLESTGAGSHVPTGASSNVPYFVVLTPGDSTTFTLHQFAPNGPELTFADNGVGTLRLIPVLFTNTRSAAAPLWGLLQTDRDVFSDSFPTIPYVSNVIDPNRMLLGLCNLYESSDYLTTVARVGSLVNPCRYRDSSKIGAMAYGGAKNGHDRWEVIYASRGGKMLIRLPTSPGAPDGQATWLTPEPLAGATVVRDVVLDPRDYTTAYAATDVGIFKRTGGSWTLISQNLLNTNFRSLAFVPGATAADGVLLVGTALGIFRAFNPAPRVTWTELGTNLPNTLVADLAYISLNNADYDSPPANTFGSRVLIAGTQGRGVWTIRANGGLTQQPVLEVTGSDSVADQFVISRSSANASLLEIRLNGSLIYTTPMASIQSIDLVGLGGNDTLTVDSTNGSVAIPGKINFTGGNGLDRVVLTGGSVVHTPRPTTTTTGAHQVAVDDVLGGGTEVVVFTDFHVAESDAIDTTGLTTGNAVQRAQDALRRLIRATNGPQRELAVIGSTLPRILSTATPEIQALDDRGPGGGTEEADLEGAS